jgi:hypothetical protein
MFGSASKACASERRDRAKRRRRKWKRRGERLGMGELLLAAARDT